MSVIRYQTFVVDHLQGGVSQSPDQLYGSVIPNNENKQVQDFPNHQYLLLLD